MIRIHIVTKEVGYDNLYNDKLRDNKSNTYVSLKRTAFSFGASWKTSDMNVLQHYDKDENI